MPGDPRDLPPRKDRFRTPRAPEGPRATIGQLGRNASWLWINCTGQGCHHYAVMTIADAVARWGADASGDVIRDGVVCQECGKRGGAMLQLPSAGEEWTPPTITHR